jgi:hypothetical protein
MDTKGVERVEDATSVVLHDKEVGILQDVEVEKMTRKLLWKLDTR